MLKVNNGIFRSAEDNPNENILKKQPSEVLFKKVFLNISQN